MKNELETSISGLSGYRVFGLLYLFGLEQITKMRRRVSSRNLLRK